MDNAFFVDQCSKCGKKSLIQVDRAETIFDENNVNLFWICRECENMNKIPVIKMSGLEDENR